LEIAQQISNFIINNFMMGRSSYELTDDDSLLDKGIIDSTGVLELVSFIEETYGFTVEDDELVPENLDSVNRLVDYINKKRQHQIRE
jgi:acyl carrier protein